MTSNVPTTPSLRSNRRVFQATESSSRHELVSTSDWTQRSQWTQKTTSSSYLGVLGLLCVDSKLMVTRRSPSTASPLGPTAHVDTFARDHLPPSGQWPDLLLDRPEFRY